MEFNLIHAFVQLSSDVDLDPYTVSYCCKRLRREGIKFLTVTLPKLSKAVLRSLELGYFERPTDFAWKRKSLRYFTKFLNRIFDSRTGFVLDVVDALAVLQLRYICDYFYKLALPFTEDDLSKAEKDFVENDDAVLGVGDYDYEYVDQLRKDLETYYPELVEATVDDILSSDPPRSGPGTFAGKKEYENFSKNPWYVRKECENSTPYAFKDFNSYSKQTSSKAFGEPPPVINTEPMVSEVLFVPKDSRGPRVIIREPFSLLRFQMAYNSYLSTYLERKTGHRINFQDQSINRRLAQTSSIRKDLATLDLKNASDSVSGGIIQHITRNCRGLRYFINRRSRTVRLPNGSLKVIKKLSGMGSGLTFPTMSLLIHLTITRALARYMSYRKAASLVYVYGDDIIVPTKYYSDALNALGRVGLKVNTDKSYRYSHFRESCGGDYYNGQDVTPVRLKLSNCNLSSSGTALRVEGEFRFLSIERHCRELVQHGLLSLANYYYSMLERFVGKLPAVTGSSPVLGRYQLQVPEYRVTGEGGEYEIIRALVPLPKSVEFSRNPWIYLKQRVLGKTSSLDYLLDTGERSDINEVFVPRSVKYRRQRVSAFRLMG